MSPPSQTPQCRFPAAGSKQDSPGPSRDVESEAAAEDADEGVRYISPRQPVPAGTTIEPLPPDPYDTPIKLQKAQGVRVVRSTGSGPGAWR